MGRETSAFEEVKFTSSNIFNAFPVSNEVFPHNSFNLTPSDAMEIKVAQDIEMD